MPCLRLYPVLKAIDTLRNYDTLKGDESIVYLFF